MSRASRVCLGIAVLVLLAMPVSAQQEDGNLAAVTWWTIDAADVEAFEAGLRAHNAFHGSWGDPTPLLTWMELSGPRQGQYGRGSFGHSWADFDAQAANGEADSADSDLHITPYIADAETTTWVFRPDISRPGAGPMPVSRVIEFVLHSLQEDQFAAVIAKIHAALDEQEDWPSYEWYQLIDGGEVPTFVVVLSRNSFAEFAPRDPAFEAVVGAKYGEETAAIFGSLAETIKVHRVSTIAFRSDLSYFPESGD